jgi:hypothetical protein
MESDMEVRTKQRCVTEFLHAETFSPIVIHRRLINAYRDQTVDVSTVKWWLVHFSGGGSCVRDRPRYGRPCTAVSSRSAQQHKSAVYGQATIDSDRYITTMTRLKARISGVRPEKKTTFLLQHDNTRPHTRVNAMEHAAKFGWTVLPHHSMVRIWRLLTSICSGPMKDGLRGQQLPDNNAIIAAV